MSRLIAPKITQGPWTYYHRKLRAQFSLVVTEVQDQHGTAIVNWGGFDGVEQPKKEVAANAKLMAKSPELAEALADLLEYETEMQGEDWMQKQSVWKKARSALLSAGYTEE